MGMLDGRVAICCGAGRGVGAEIAKLMAAHGARVVVNDPGTSGSGGGSGHRPAQQVVDEIAAAGGKAAANFDNIATWDGGQALVAQVVDELGGLDIVVNNAAWMHACGILEEDLASFNRAITIAVNGNFLYTKHAALAMAERGIKGSIVSILSSNAWQGAPGFIAYATHKGGLANFVRAAAMDLAPYGIRVNSFTPTAPRPDNPELLAQWRAEGRTELRPPRRDSGERPSWWRPTGRYDVRGNIPMGEPATPTDIGHCIAWLSSDYARLITGCDFVVDGGARAKYWAYTPDAGAAAGPVPLIPLDVSSEAFDSEAVDG